MKRASDDRRRVLVGLASLALAACKRSPPPPPPSPSPTPAPETSSAAWRELTFDPGEDTPEGQRALVFTPPSAHERPLLVALHGRGESGRGLEIGARAWRDDYGVGRVHERLLAPPLKPADLLGIVSPDRLALLNASLKAEPFRGMTLVCPYTPNVPDKSPEGALGFARFVTETLLPRARSESSAKADRAMTGIDGVSMGGRLALLVGLSRPDVFGAVGALQPALKPNEGPMISELARGRTRGP
jgi:iron(III)-salmochelin esterase